jgi:cytoskeletal protein RodZ
MATLLSDSSPVGPPIHTCTSEGDRAGLGELLRRARERRGLTLAQISSETKIPQRHLEALEHDNFAAVPNGFYRRAETRAFARAVNLDLSLALAQLERALEPSVVREAVPETSGTQEPTRSWQGWLIVIGVVVGAAVFGRATGGREPALDGPAHGHRATDSQQQSGRPSRETPLDAVRTSQRTQLDQVVPSAPSEGALAVAAAARGVRASGASTGDPAVTTERAQAPTTPDSVTELVVITQPAGARVTVDGIGWGNTPVTVRYLPEGDKRVRVSKDGYATEEQVVYLPEGHARRLDIRLRSAP